MKVAIMTIPHTGTHFVLDLLGGTRNDLADWMNKKFYANGHQFYVSHTYRLPLFEMVEDEGYTIVSTIRHPLTTVRSWYDDLTKNPLPPLDATRETVEFAERYVKPEWVPELYKGLIVASELYDINFIPIDSPYRQDYLDCFNKKFDMDLSTEWKPLNSHGKTTLDIPEELREKTEALLKENEAFFGRFY